MPLPEEQIEPEVFIPGVEVKAVLPNRHLISPVNFKSVRILEEYARESKKTFFASHNDLCSSTTQLIVLASELCKNFPDYSRHVGVSLRAERSVPLYWAANSASNVKNTNLLADLLLTKTGLGRRGSGIALVTSLPAVFVIKSQKPNMHSVSAGNDGCIAQIDTLLSTDLMFADRVEKYLPLWGPNPDAPIRLANEMFDGVSLDLPLVLSLLQNYGYSYAANQLPITTYTNRLSAVKQLFESL